MIRARDRIPFAVDSQMATMQEKTFQKLLLEIIIKAIVILEKCRRGYPVDRANSDFHGHSPVGTARVRVVADPVAHLGGKRAAKSPVGAGGKGLAQCQRMMKTTKLPWALDVGAWRGG